MSIVLGAGIVGVSAALHLQARGRRSSSSIGWRGRGRDQLRQYRHRAERGGLPLRVSAPPARYHERPRSIAIRARHSLFSAALDRAVALALFPRSSPRSAARERAGAARAGRALSSPSIRPSPGQPGRRSAAARGRLDQGVPHRARRDDRARRRRGRPALRRRRSTCSNRERLLALEPHLERARRSAACISATR